MLAICKPYGSLEHHTVLWGIQSNYYYSHHTGEDRLREFSECGLNSATQKCVCREVLVCELFVTGQWFNMELGPESVSVYCFLHQEVLVLKKLSAEGNCA